MRTCPEERGIAAHCVKQQLSVNVGVDFFQEFYVGEVAKQQLVSQS